MRARARTHTHTHTPFFILCVHVRMHAYMFVCMHVGLRKLYDRYIIASTERLL